MSGVMEHPECDNAASRLAASPEAAESASSRRRSRRFRERQGSARPQRSGGATGSSSMPLRRSSTPPAGSGSSSRVGGGPQSQGVPLNTKPDESFCALKTGGRNATKITITGHVLQYFTCTPVSESSSLAFIDVWQADNAGEYDDNSNLANADCRTRVPIAADGSYKYTTIIPAAYGSRNCLRPPHIHLRLALSGYALLVTQDLTG
eukprot:XP_001701156.1 predicted protein [Chlamydomonas reinhardtii]